MDLSTVSSAVNDALAGLPAGTSDFINQNIGTPQGQQAILQAGLSLGLSQAQIAAAVSQATGMTVTPEQVAQVAQSITPANTVANTVVPAQPYSSASAPATASTQEPSKEFQTTYNALQYGNARVIKGKDASGNSINQVVDGKGNVLPATVVELPNGSYDLQIPSAGGIIHTITAPSSSGTLQPIQDYNTQVQYTGGKSGGVLSNLLSNPLIQLAASVAIPGAAPIIAGANAVNAASKGNIGGALLNAGLAAYTGGLFDTTPTPTGTSSFDTGNFNAPVGNTTGLGATDYSLGTGSSGLGLNVAQGEGLNLFDTSAVNPATGLANGLGLQAPGSTNLASMGGGQGLTIPGSTGSSTTPNAVLGAAGTTNYGTGGLPTNQLTGQTLGTSLNNISTGVTTPSTLITNGSGKVAGSTVGGLVNNAGSTTGLTSGGTTGGSTNGLSTVGGLLAGSALAGTGILNGAISNANRTQTLAANNVNDVLSGLYNQYAQAQQPYQNLGSGAVSEIQKQAPYLTHQFNAADLAAGLAPNYDFMLAQGQGANRNLANVGGGLLSGNTLQGLNKFTQDYAQNAYQNAFNNYQTQRQNIYQNLSNAAGLGQTSLGQLGQVGSNLAQTYGNVTTGLAAAQAGAQTAQAVNNANLLSNLAKTGTVLALA
jgi:hypothetical protein